MEFVEFVELFNKIVELTKDHPSGLVSNINVKKEIAYESSSPVILAFPPSFLRSQSWWISKTVGAALRNNMRLYNVKSPMKKLGENKFVPVVQSRMFIDDVPYGLCVLLGIAEIVGVEMPTCKRMVYSLQKMMGKQYILETPNAQGNIVCGRDVGETWAPQTYGVHTPAALKDHMVWDRAADLAKYASNVDFRANNAHILPSKL